MREMKSNTGRSPGDCGSWTGMTLLTRIKEQVALITFLAVLLATVVYAFTRMRPSGQMGTGEVIVYVLMVLSFYVVSSVIPAIAVIYGWYTGNRIGSVLIGVCLLPVIFILGYIVISNHNMVFFHVTGTIVYVAILSGIAGFAGYCAAQRTKSCLSVAIALNGIWIFVLMQGFN